MKVLLVGGPGAGKTTVLHSLKAMGFNTATDTARAIIRERKASGLPPRPRPEAFFRAILKRDVMAYKNAESVTFFERGIPDALAGLVAVNALNTLQAHKKLAEYPYHPTVFLFPAWEAIYRTDEERDHTFAHAQQVCRQTREWYQRCGFAICEVPQASVSERVKLILETLELH